MTMRFLSLTSFVCLASLASAQDTSIRVTYTTRAARAAVVLEDLGRLANIKLLTTPETEREILIVSVKDQPFAEVMSRIATVTSCEWKQEGASYRLIPNRKQRTLEERAEIAKRLAHISKGIKDLESAANMRRTALEKSAAELKKAHENLGTKSVSVPPTPESAVPFATNLNARIGMTSQLALVALLKEIDPSVLAQMGLEDREVFSTAPTRMQHGLGGDATEIVNTFVQEHNEQLASLPNQLEPDTTGMDPKEIEALRAMQRQRTAKVSDVSKAIVVARYRGFSENAAFSLNLRLYDSKGTTVYTSSAIIRGAVPGGQVGSASPDSEKQSEAKSTPIEYSDDSKALMAANKGLDGTYKYAFSPELRRKLFLPKKYDPLSFTTTDEILAFAKSKGKPLVADIPDDYGGFSDDEPTNVEAVNLRVEHADGIAAIPDDSFTVIKPATPTLSREVRADRFALSALMHAVEEKGVPSLDDYSTFAVASPNPWRNFTTAFITSLIPGGLMQGFSQSPNWNMLRFYGHLSSEARSHLTGGSKLPFSQLSSAQRSELDQMTFGSFSQLAIDDPQRQVADSVPDWGNGSTAVNDYRNEPTEVAPTGLPAAGYLELAVRKESFASPQEINGGSRAMGVLGPEEMATLKASRDSREGQESPALFPSMNNLKIGENLVLNFTFHIAPQVVIKQRLNDHHFPNNPTIVSETNLPADFQKQIADRLEIIKKYGNSPKGPPPHRRRKNSPLTTGHGTGVTGQVRKPSLFSVVPKMGRGRGGGIRRHLNRRQSDVRHRSGSRVVSRRPARRFAILQPAAFRSESSFTLARDGIGGRGTESEIGCGEAA